MTVILSPKLLKKVSAFQNSCALLAGANLIVDELLAVNDDAIDTTDSQLFAWKSYFLNYYGLAADTPLSAIRNLFRKFPHPQDQQIILGGPLRAMLIALTPEAERAEVAVFQFLNAENAAVLFNHLGISFEAYTRDAPGENEYTSEQFLLADATKTLKIVHNYEPNIPRAARSSFHWQTLAEDDASAATHNTAFLATNNRIKVLAEAQEIKDIVTQEMNCPTQTPARLKTDWLSLINREKAKANERSAENCVNYHYYDDANHIVSFWTSAAQQIKMDGVLAERIAREEDLAGEFIKLPKFNS